MADSVPLLGDLLSWHDRLLFAGVPWSGKSTLAGRVDDGRLVVHTDDFIEAGWDEAPRVAAAQVAGLRRFVIEGVRALATLREGVEVDAVVWLSVPLRELSVTEGRWARNRQTNFEKWLAVSSYDAGWARSSGPVVYVVGDVTEL